MRARLTSGQFIGRLGELAELELCVSEAAAERPSLVLLGGDSGVGKTRLIAEFERGLRRAAAEDGAPQGGGSRAVPLILRGEAVEQADGELPYAPLLGALRPLVRDRHPVLDKLAAGSRAELATLLPALGDGRRGGERGDPAAQLRLFEALLELLDLLGQEQPTVLILEDLHWADRSTRAFVAFLARSLREERVMVLLSFRTDELHRRHPLRPLLAELERLERTRRLDLVPLHRPELAEVLHGILGAPPDEALLERIYARSEGNPLYTEELLAAGLDGRGAPPQSLRDAFLLRIERLSPDAQRAVRTIAVGRRLDGAMVARLAGFDGPARDAALREALAEQILETDEEGRFGFRHALLREVVLDDLLPGERSELHKTLAEVLEQAPPSSTDGDLERTAAIARHYAAAGDQPAALRASVRAALAACQVHAPGEMAELAERALELWPRVADAQQFSELDHVELLVLAGDGHRAASDYARSEVLLQAALGEVDPDREPRRYADVLASLARTQWALNRGLTGVETAQRALALLGEEDSGPGRAGLLSWLARTRFLRGRFRDALGDAESALEVATAAGDDEIRAEALNTLGMTRIALGRVEDGSKCLREAIDLARAGGNIDGLSTAYGNLADLLNLRGQTREALEIAREGLASIPRRLGVGRDWLALQVSELEFEAGDWHAARQHLGPPPVQHRGVLAIFRLLREADTALGEGDQDRAAAALEQAEPLVAASSEPQWIGGLGSLLAELRRRRGDLAGARAAVDDALGRIELCTDDVMRIARTAGMGARVEADLAQRGRDLGDPRMTREAVTRARLHAERLRAVALDGGPVERAWSLMGAAELTRARGRSNPGAWARAAEAWERLERPYMSALCRWREAEALVELGDRAAAAKPAAGALAIATGLGARWLALEVNSLQDRARLERDGAAADAEGDGRDEDERDAAGAGAGPAEEPFGLTPRERQVLALIAQGATNRQIGAQLYMAEKTASVHVSRILAKLGVQSRTQAAAVAHRMHLATAGH